MNILLTGGAGYIGSHTAFSLIDNNHKVTIVDNLITGSHKLIPQKANFINTDIDNKAVVSDLLKNNSFDLVMHFAGLVKVDESLRFPEKYNLYNFKKPKIFFDLCLENGLNKIIFSSTAAVYGKSSKQNKLDENSQLNPSNPYAKSKNDLEKYLVTLSMKNKIKCVILRYFNVAGADSKKRSGLLTKNSNNLIKVVCEVATEKRKKLLINGKDYDTKDGTPIRDFIHVSDLVDMHLIASEYLNKNEKSDIFNCGYGNGYSVKEVVEEMEKILKHDLNHEFGPRREGDIPYSVADSNKFKSKFNWMPKYNNLNQILHSALEWEKII